MACNEQNKRTLKLGLFIIEAFSLNHNIYKDIDALYATDRNKFLSLSKNSEFYNHPMAQIGSIEQEFYFKKALGIFVAAEEDQNILNHLLSIVKKGWHYAFTFVQKNNRISLSEFLINLRKKTKYMLTNDEIHSNTAILLLLASQFGKEVENQDQMLHDVMEGWQLRLGVYESDSELKLSIDNATEQQKSDLNEYEVTLRKCLGEVKPLSYTKFGRDLSMQELTATERFMLGFNYVVDFENLSLPLIAKNCQFSAKDLQEIIFCYTQMLDGEVDLNELLKFVYPAVQLRFLLKSYREAKRFCLDHSDESTNTTIEKLSKINKGLTRQVSLLKATIEDQSQDLMEAQRMIRRIKSEVLASIDNQQELLALREFAFHAINQRQDLEETKPLVDLASINAQPGVIVGGHSNWQKRLKERLPDWKFIGADALNFDEAVLKNKEHIFLNVNYISHSMYYKVAGIVERFKLNLHLLNVQNIDRCIEYIGRAIQK